VKNDPDYSLEQLEAKGMEINIFESNLALADK